MKIVKEFIRLKKKVYIYEEIKIGWLRFCFYRYGKRFCVRCELSRGWD
jgi:hypothetical protein